MNLQHRILAITAGAVLACPVSLLAQGQGGGAFATPTMANLTATAGSLDPGSDLAPSGNSAGSLVDPPTPSEPPTACGCTGGTYTLMAGETITHAILFQAPGTTILIPAGGYGEAVVINKQLCLVGLDSPTSHNAARITPPAGSIAIDFQTSGACVQNVRVQQMGSPFAAVRIGTQPSPRSSNRFLDNVVDISATSPVTDPQAGVYVFGDSNDVARNLVVGNNDRFGIWVDGRTGNRVKRNHVSSFNWSILLWPSTGDPNPIQGSEVAWNDVRNSYVGMSSFSTTRQVRDTVYYANSVAQAGPSFPTSYGFYASATAGESVKYMNVSGVTYGATVYGASSSFQMRASDVSATTTAVVVTGFGASIPTVVEMYDNTVSTTAATSTTAGYDLLSGTSPGVNFGLISGGAVHTAGCGIKYSSVNPPTIFPSPNFVRVLNSVCIF